MLSFTVIIFGASATFGLKTFPSTLFLGILIGVVVQVTNFLIVKYINYSISTEHYWTHT